MRQRAAVPVSRTYPIGSACVSTPSGDQFARDRGFGVGTVRRLLDPSLESRQGQLGDTPVIRGNAKQDQLIVDIVQGSSEEINVAGQQMDNTRRLHIQ